MPENTLGQSVYSWPNLLTLILGVHYYIVLVLLYVSIHSEQKRKFKSHENVCKNHNYCNLIMPGVYEKILKFN